MSDIHVMAELLRAIERGEVEPDVLVQILLPHLLMLCPTCKAEVESFSAEPEGTPASSDFERVFDELIERAPGLVRGLDVERQRAEQDFEYLLKLDEVVVFGRIKRAHRRFKSPFLAEILLAECRRALPAAARRAGFMARLAHAVAVRTPEPLSNELETLALAHQGNAHRAQGELLAASDCLDKARCLVRTRGIVDLLTVAEVDWIEGVLARDQRRFKSSEVLLNRATVLYRVAGDDVLVASVLISLGDLYRDLGDFEQAIATTTRAAELLEDQDRPRLLLCAVHNHLFYLADSGAFEEAREGLQGEYERYQAFPDAWTQLRLAWLEAKIACGLGEEENGFATFRAVRDGFVREGNGYDAALVSLELAAALLSAGRTAEVREVAEEIAPIFAAKDVHREAAAALMLFQDAARQEALTLAMVLELERYLEQARRDPRLRYREGS